MIRSRHSSIQTTDQIYGQANLKRALDYPGMTEELAEFLSTETAGLRYDVETGINVESD